MDQNNITGVQQFAGKLQVVCSEGSAIAFDGVKSARGKIKVEGVGNRIEFSKDSLLNADIRIHGNNNKIIVGEGCAIRGQILVKGNGQQVIVGEGTTFQSVYILCQESCNVTIGRWCMFSRDIEVRTTDAHSVVSKISGERLNAPASVSIADHVWVSVGALISKGSVIPEDTIVGANSFVNGIFNETSTIIAGAPAKVVKKEVTWNRSRKSKFNDEELYFWKS